MRTWCKWGMDQFLRRLEGEICLFEATLCDLADSYRPVDESGWHTVERAIRTRCGTHYGQYLDSVDNVLVAVRGIAELTGVASGSDTAAAWSSVAELLSNKPETFVFGIGSVNGFLGGELDVHLTRISTANDSLTSLRKRLHEAPSSAPFERLAALRQHAERVARILGPHDGFTCAHKTHRAFVWIKQYFWDRGAGSDDPIRDEVCSLVFHDAMAASWRWVEMTAETCSLHQSLPQRDVGECQSPEALCAKESCSRGPKTALTKKPRSGGNCDTDVGQVPVQPKHSGAPPSIDPEIGLCSFLASHTCMSPEGPLPSPNSITLSRKNDEYQLRLSLDPSAEVQKTCERSPISLPARYASCDLSALSTEEKLKLAVKVASSLFYLHSTPWLAESWNTDELFLIYTPGGAELEGPLLSQRLQRQGPSPAGQHAGQQTDVSSHTNLTITRLGRFLVELWYGASWDRVRDSFIRSPESCPTTECDTEILVFSHVNSLAVDASLADEARPFYLEGNSYADAVRNCFLCDFGQKEASLGDEAFCMGVFFRILRPLQYALEDFYALQSRIYGPMKGLGARVSSYEAQRLEEPEDLMLFDDESLGADSEAM